MRPKSGYYAYTTVPSTRGLRVVERYQTRSGFHTWSGEASRPVRGTPSQSCGVLAFHERSNGLTILLSFVIDKVFLRTTLFQKPGTSDFLLQKSPFFFEKTYLKVREFKTFMQETSTTWCGRLSSVGTRDRPTPLTFVVPNSVPRESRGPGTRVSAKGVTVVGP